MSVFTYYIINSPGRKRGCAQLLEKSHICSLVHFWSPEVHYIHVSSYSYSSYVDSLVILYVHSAQIMFRHMYCTHCPGFNSNYFPLGALTLGRIFFLASNWFIRSLIVYMPRSKACFWRLFRRQFAALRCVLLATLFLQCFPHSILLEENQLVFVVIGCIENGTPIR